MIGERFNFEDVFFRDLTVCVLDTLEGEVRWVNKFSSGDRVVNVPFYYSMTGDERFLLDAFTDDIVSNNRYVDLNTDVIPRGHLTMTSYEIRADEFANPNVWLKMVVENSDEIRNMLTKVRAIPITVKYDLTILLSSEIDTFKCSQAIMDTLWLYRYMYFEYNFMNIDAVMMIPDTSAIEMQREKTLTSDNTISLKISFDVQTYYPAFRKPKLPDILPYSISESSYISKTLNVRIDVSRPESGFSQGILAKSNVVINKLVPLDNSLDFKINFPNDETNFITNFTFSGNTISEQSNELSNYINQNTNFNSTSSASNITIRGPVGSGQSLNGSEITISSLPTYGPSNIGQWSPNVQMELGELVITTTGNIYVCVLVGTTGLIEPIHTSGISSNGTVNFLWVGDYTSNLEVGSWKPNESVAIGNIVVTQAKNVYISTVSGVTGTNPPSNTSGQSTDGSVTWLWIDLADDINTYIETNIFSGGSDVDKQNSKVIFSENHTLTTSSDGSMVIPIGAGYALTGNYLSTNLKESGLKLDVLIDVNRDGNYIPLETASDIEPISTNQNVNDLFSNSFAFANQDGDFRDIITLPKRTRWYANLLNLKGGGQIISRNPYTSQDINNQKKL